MSENLTRLLRKVEGLSWTSASIANAVETDYVKLIVGNIQQQMKTVESLFEAPNAAVLLTVSTFECSFLTAWWKVRVSEECFCS